VTAAQQTLARFPGDATATSWLARAATLQPGQPQSPQQAQVVPPQATADAYINDSLAFFRAGNFQGCIDSARKALQLKPDYAEAWNNVGACQNSLGHWDEGIKAELQAIRFKPDFQLAKNNLAWAQESKAKQGR
jgi:Flp pilus assembly protein TadD